MNAWTVFKCFDSEVEGRVVESFLRAQGFEVQLLDTHTPTHRVLPSRLGALRLMVRPADVEAITATLNENQKGNHLKVVTDQDDLTPHRPKRERWIFVAVVLLLLLTYVLTKLVS